MNFDRLTSLPSFTSAAMQAEVAHSPTIFPFCCRDLSAALQHAHDAQTGYPIVERILVVRMQSTKYAVSALSASTCSILGAHMSPDR